MSAQELNSPNLVVPQDLVEVLSFLSVGFTTTNTVSPFDDVTGMSFHVEASKDYFVEMVLLVSTTLFSNGIRLGVNGPAGKISITGTVEFAAGSGDVPVRGFNDYIAVDTKNLNNLSDTTNCILLNCIFRNGVTEGTFQLKLGSETGSVVGIDAGSSIVYRKMN